jgi:hypothetical protein
MVAVLTGTVAMIATAVHFTSTGTAQLWVAMQVIAGGGTVAIATHRRSPSYQWLGSVLWLMTGVFLAELLYLLSLS